MMPMEHDDALAPNHADEIDEILRTLESFRSIASLEEYLSDSDAPIMEKLGSSGSRLEIWVLTVLLSEAMMFNIDVRIREMSVALLPQLSCILSSQLLCEILLILRSDARSRLDSRIKGYDDRKCPGSEAILGCLETEGWGSLETSLKAIRLLLRTTDLSFAQGEYVGFADVIVGSIRHTNRYAREQGQLCLAEMFRSPLASSFLDEPQDLVVTGLQDNWSQVRYASLLALSSFLRESIRMNRIRSIRNELLIHFLINRHFPAEGIRRLSQSLWRMYTGPQGGRIILQPNMKAIIVSLSELMDTDNHSQREAIVSLALELVQKVILPVAQPRDPEIPSYLLKICIHGLEDDAWFVRLLSVNLASILFSSSIMIFSNDLSDFSNSSLERIVDLLVFDCVSAFSELRRGSVNALMKVLHWSRSVNRFRHLCTKLTLVVDKSVSLEAMKNLTCHSLVEEKCDRHENRPMYSCGTLLSNRQLGRSSRHSTSDECCSSIGQEIDPGSTEIIHGLLGIYRAFLSDPVLRKCEEAQVLRESFTPSIGFILSCEDLPGDLYDVADDIARLNQD